MQNVLLILLHRPFVAEGHLHSQQSSVAVSSFLTCATAATNITHILRVYDRTFSIGKAPYIMSYATYVSATIHVRIAAQRERGSEAHASLATCLKLLRANEATNWAVKKASVVIHDLMTRMGVSVSEEPAYRQSEIHGGPGLACTQQPNPAGNDTALTRSIDETEGDGDKSRTNLDIDAIIQSFTREQYDERHHGQEQADDVAQTRGPIGLHNNTRSFFRTSSGQTYLPAHAQQSYQPQLENLSHEVVNEYDGYTGQTVNDMLFGFNGSGLDVGGWQFGDNTLTPETYRVPYG